MRPDEVPICTISRYLDAPPGCLMKSTPTSLIEREARVVFILENDFGKKMEDKPVSIPRTIMGSTHQGHEAFGPDAGSQCTAVALIFLVMVAHIDVN